MIMGLPNKPRSQVAPKVEARSKTEAPYNRAGVRWSAAWTEVPKELLEDKVRYKALRDDAFIELRVDGKRINKETGEPLETSTLPANSEETLRLLRGDLGEIRIELNELRELRARETEAHDAEVTDLRRQIEQLQIAAKAPAPAPTQPAQVDAKPDQKSAPTISSEGQPPAPLAPTASASETPKNTAKR